MALLTNVHEKGNSMETLPCPRCGAAMNPHMGRENGPTESWAHPADTKCQWNEYEGITNRQVAGVITAKRRK